MKIKDLEQLLNDFKAGKIGSDAILQKIKAAGIQSLDFATIDHHRELRQGFPEVIFCEGKTPEEVAEIARRIYQRHGLLLATRATEEYYREAKAVLPELQYHARARLMHSPFPEPNRQAGGQIAIITAGTSDIPVAEEARITCQLFGFTPETIYDVGVAGLHRLNEHWSKIQPARVLIVIAGMEGALPSVIGGLVDKPVIAVPTSVGYGTSLQGMTALLAMLNSCSSNVVVVNIDNGFGAGFSASLILRQMLTGAR